MDFKTTDYLRSGTAKQQKTFRILTEHAILKTLAPYQPIVVGTIPLDIDIDGSDVDILLYTEDLPALERLLTQTFSKYTNFEIRIAHQDGLTVLICQFAIEKLPFELYATAIETDRQPAYLHLLKEYGILRKEGRVFANKIRALKQQGIKTEPAFCQLLGIAGDPYKTLLAYDAER